MPCMRETKQCSLSPWEWKKCQDVSNIVLREEAWRNKTIYLLLFRGKHRSPLMFLSKFFFKKKSFQRSAIQFKWYSCINKQLFIHSLSPYKKSITWYRNQEIFRSLFLSIYRHGFLNTVSGWPWSLNKKSATLWH